MDRTALNFGFSSCPNDTFAFHAIVHGLVHGPPVTPHIDDVEALNARAERGEAEVTKVSLAAYGRIRDRYALLRAGGAAGFGVGPIVVARESRSVGGRIAVPGERTTAALLLNLLNHEDTKTRRKDTKTRRKDTKTRREGTKARGFETVPMRFDRIEDAVLRGEVDCGVLIHEGRFTYQAKGLALLEDLGTVWEQRMKGPLPLAAIAIRRDLADAHGAALDRALRSSVEYAQSHPDASRAYVAAHAQEMDSTVVAKHIALYVNAYTIALDERAVLAFLEWADLQRGQRPGIQAVFI